MSKPFPTPPRIEFHTADRSIERTPTAAALTLKLLIARLGLVPIWRDLEMDKHHGLPAADLLLILLLYACYNVHSIEQLQKQARQDQALAAVITDITAVNNKLLLYFQQLNDPQTLALFLDRAILAMQNHRRFASRPDGIIAVDDSLLEKTGKHMPKISIVYDHVDKRYVLGYVMVSALYADDRKAYPLNFLLRLPTDSERQEQERQALKKEHQIDLRKPGAWIDYLQQCEKNATLPEFIELSGIHLDPATLQAVERKQIPWVGLPNSKTKLLDPHRQRWEFDHLQRLTRKKKPVILETTGWHLRSTTVFLQDHGTLDFLILGDADDNPLGAFLIKPLPRADQVRWLQDYFDRQQPADNSKLSLALQTVSRAKKSGIKAETVAVDAWYFAAWLVAQLLELPGIARVVSRLKSTHRVTYQGKSIPASDLFSLLPFRPIGDRSRKVATALVHLESFHASVQLVLIQEFDRSRRLKAQFILVCTDIRYPTRKIIRAYKLRWQIEVFYRTAKQRFALTQFHTRSLDKIHCHLTLVFLAYLLVAQLRLRHPQLRHLTFGEIIDLFLNTLVTIKIRGAVLHVFLDPAFVLAFGRPCDTS